MKILVVGRGWTGTKVIDQLTKLKHEVVAVSHVSVFDLLDKQKFDWVINCAGITGTPNVDACEHNKLATYYANALFPIELYHACEKLHIRFGHVSSGCIYQGMITDVDADPNYFGSTYSISKGLSDTYLKDKAQVYRIRMPFTGVNESKNYLVKVRNYATTAKLIEGGSNSLTDLDEATQVIAHLITTHQPNGAYNLVNAGNITMHELIDMMGIVGEWYTDEEFQSVTLAGRSNCVIPSYSHMRPLKDALTQAIQTL